MEYALALLAIFFLTGGTKLLEGFNNPNEDLGLPPGATLPGSGGTMPGTNIPVGNPGSTGAYGQPYTGQNTTANEALYWNNPGGIIKTASVWSSFNEMPPLTNFYWKRFPTLQDGINATVYNLMYIVNARNIKNVGNIVNTWTGTSSFTCPQSVSGLSSGTQITNRQLLEQLAYGIMVCENGKVRQLIFAPMITQAYDFVASRFPNLTQF